MAQNTPYPHREERVAQVLEALADALGRAEENLPDVEADPSFGVYALADCKADIAALRQLLKTDSTGWVNIESYL